MKRYIETSRLLLRPFQQTDRADLFDLASDRETCLNGWGREPFTDETNPELDELLSRFMEDAGRYAIVLRESGKVIGTISVFAPEERAVPAKEIGYLLHRNHRRQGLASEAVEAVAEACFADGNRLVLAEGYAFNTGSMRMLEKLSGRASPAVPYSIALTA